MTDLFSGLPVVGEDEKKKPISQPGLKLPELPQYDNEDLFGDLPIVGQEPEAPSPAPPPLQHKPTPRASLFKPEAAGIMPTLLGLDQEEQGYGDQSQAKMEEKAAVEARGNRTIDLMTQGGKQTMRAQEVGFGMLSKILPDSGGYLDEMDFESVPEAGAMMRWGENETTKAFMEAADRKELDIPDDFVMPRNWWEGFVMASPQVVGQAVTTAIGGHALGTLAMFGQIAGGSYDELVKSGVDEDRAMAFALANAVMQAPLEQLGMGTITSVWKPQIAILKRLKNLGKHMLTEGLTEFLQKYPEEITSIIAKNPGNELNDHLKNIHDNLLDWTKEGLAWDLPIGMAMGAFFGSPGMINRRGAFDPDSMPKAKDKRTRTQKVGDWLKEHYGVEGLFTPGIVAADYGAEKDTKVKKTTAEGAKEVDQGKPAPLTVRDAEQEGRTAAQPEKLKYKPADREKSKQFIEITEAAQRAIEKRNVDDEFLDALAETIDELTPKQEGPKSTLPPRIVTPVMVEQAEQKARARRIAKEIEQKGTSYDGEPLLDSRTGLPFKTEAAAQVAITRLKQENPRYKNWEWEVVKANVNVNKGFGLKPVRPMKRTAAIVRNAMRKNPQAKIGEVYKQVKEKAPEEKATRQEVAKMVKNHIPSTQAELKSELDRLGQEEFNHQYNPLNLEARLVKELTDKGTSREDAKKQVRSEVEKYTKLYNSINGKALEARAEKQAEKEKKDEADKQQKGKDRGLKLEVGTEVMTEDGRGKITGGREGQWYVRLSEGEERGEIYLYGEDELEAPVPTQATGQIEMFPDLAQAAKEAEEALENLKKEDKAIRAKNGIVTRAVGITKKLIKGSVNLVGHKVPDSVEAAQVFQVWRDPRFEVSRVVYLKDNVIVHHEGITVKQPHHTPAFRGKKMSDGLQHINDMMEKYGADSWVLVHNHPSGKPTPSGADVENMTKIFLNAQLNNLNKVWEGMKYSLVLNSGEYGVVSRNVKTGEINGRVHKLKGAPAVDKLLQPSLRHPGLKRYANRGELALLGKALKTGEDFVSIMFLDTDNNMRLIQDIPKVYFDQGRNTIVLERHIRRMARDHGAIRVYLYTSGGDFGVEQRAYELMQNAYINDYLYFDIDNRLQSLQDNNKAVYDMVKKTGIHFGRARHELQDVLLKDKVANTGDQTITGEIKGDFKAKPKFKEKQKKRAMATSRTLGAVGKKAIVPRVVRAIAKKTSKILDFGAGKDAAHAKALREEGFKVDAYDFHLVGSGKYLDNKYDTIYMSNVLNVQGDIDMLNTTLDQVVGALAEGGVVIANYPASPRVAGFSPSELVKHLEQRFSIERVGKDLAGANLVYKLTPKPVQQAVNYKAKAEAIKPHDKKLMTDKVRHNHRVDLLRSTFRDGVITRKGEKSYTIKLPNGTIFTINFTDKIIPDPVAFKMAYKKDYEGETINGSFNGKDIFFLAKEDVGTSRHEAFHAALKLILTPAEYKRVVKRHGTEEKAAMAYESWTPTEAHTAFEKIVEFFRRVAGMFGLRTREQLLTDIHTGAVWGEYYNAGILQKVIHLGMLGDGSVKYAYDRKKWDYPEDSTEFGSVNNRLSKELEVAERLLGLSPYAQDLPGKGKGKKQETTRSIKTTDFARWLQENKAFIKRLLDAKISPKKLANDRGLKGKARKAFIEEVEWLRKDTGILSDNGKAGRSVDFILATCQPTTPCQECYAGKGMTRMSTVRKGVRNTFKVMTDPVAFGKAIASEVMSIAKTKLPFVRLLGAGDVTSSEQVKAFNILAKNIDRPIHIFSRHHDNLGKLKGTQIAPFIKMGSVDSQLIKHYGLKYLKENMEKRGIANVYLMVEEADIKMIEELEKAGALSLVFPTSVKLYEKLPARLQNQSCPCDANERTYFQSCRRCAMSQLGCMMSFADKGADSKGKLWKLTDQKAPLADLKPMTQFVVGDEVSEAFGRVAADIIGKSISLARLNISEFKKGNKKRIALKDLRHPDDIFYTTDIEVAQQYIDNLNHAKKEALKGEFELPGGQIQPDVVYVGGKQVAYSAEPNSKAEWANIWYSQLIKQVGEKLPNKGTGKSYAQTLQSWAKKGMFKQEELEWSGLMDWLADNANEKLTRGDVLEYLGNNSVAVRETMYGGESQTDVPALEWTEDAHGNSIAYVHDGGGGYYTIAHTGGRLYDLLFTDGSGESVTMTTSTISYESALNFAEQDHDETYRTELFDRGLYPKNTLYDRDNLVEPGGEDYRELIITLPGKPGQFISSHWEDIDNPLLHVRFNTRKGPNGEKILFVEEIQSDWHQEGRKKGYKQVVFKTLKDAEKALQGQVGKDAVFNKVRDYTKDKWGKRGKAVARYDSKGAYPDSYTVYEMDDGTFQLEKPVGLVADAPFKSTWPALGMKRIIRWAAENGFDRVAWTPGVMQVKRYQDALRKSVDTIEYTYGVTQTEEAKRWYTKRFMWMQDSALDWWENTAESELQRRTDPDSRYLLGLGESRDFNWYNLARNERNDVVSMFKKIHAKHEPMVYYAPWDELSPPTQEAVQKKWMKQYVQEKEADADRSRVVITAKKKGDRVFQQTIPMEGTTTINNKEVTLEDVVGDKLAQKIRESKDREGKFEGKDLTIGGKGMRAFYDQILVNTVNKLVKGFGAKTEVKPLKFRDTSNFGKFGVKKLPMSKRWAIVQEMEGAAHIGGLEVVEEYGLFDSKEAADAQLNYILNEYKGEDVHSVEITDKMKTVVLTEGQPMFKADVAETTPAVDENIPVEEMVDRSLDDIFGAKNLKWRDRLKQWWKDFSFKTMFLDEFHPILNAFGDADPDSTVYKLHRMLNGIHASIEAFMRHGKLRLQDGVLTVDTKDEGYAKWVAKHGDHARDALRWAAAKRALELHENRDDFAKVEGMLTVEEAEGILEKLGERPEGYDLTYKELYEQHDEFHQSVLDIAEETGVISSEQRELWRDFTYVPLYRVFENAETKEEFFKNPKSGLHIATKLKKIKGSKLKVNEPLQNAIANWSYLLQESMRNKARAEAYFTAQRFNKEIGSEIVREIPEGEIEGIVLKDGILSYKTKGGDPNVMSFLQNGERLYFQVSDTALFNALATVNKEGFGKFFDLFFAKPKRWLTYGATFGPAFRVANMIRDTLHTWMITPGVGFKPFYDTAIGFVKAMRNDQDVIRNMAAGGLHGGSYINAEDPKALGKFTQDLIKEENRKWGDNVLNTPRKLLDFWMKMGEASENAARIMRFKQREQGGASLLEASYESRDLLDFAMKGGAGPVRAIIGMIPFLNARMQGNYRMYRGMKENGIDFFVKGAILAAASLALWAMFRDDDRYKELEDHEKFSYYHIWIGDGEDGHFRIPKPFETGVFFSTLFESIANVASGNEELEFMAKFATHAAGETFMFNPLPQTIKPVYEVYANKSFFTGRPIEGASLQKLKPGQRAEHYTSETLRAIGGKLNLSPKKMDHLARGYLASMSSFLLFGPDQIARWFGGFPEKPTPKTNDYPMIGRFWRTGPARNTKYMTRFYDLLKESNELVATVKHYKQLGDHDKAAKLKQENLNTIRFNKRLKKIQRKLSKIRKKMKKVHDSSISADAKADRIDQLTRQRNRITKQAYDIYVSKL